MKASSQSSSALLKKLLYGLPRKGAILGPRALVFGDYVVSITDPGEPRMPNGFECRVTIPPYARATIGRGSLVVGRAVITPGTEWNPVPAFERIESLPAGPEPLADAIAAWAGGPAAAGSPLLAGYVAGLVLLHAQRRRADQITARASRGSDPLSSTLLSHAALGEVPEPVHALLAQGDAAPLLAYGSAGMLWLRGLISAGLPFDPARGLLAPAGRTPALRRP